MALLLCFILAFGYIATSASLPAEESSSSNPPHILFIVADDMGWTDVGYHGSLIQTPNLDQLSREGLTLESYYVQSMCTPTRAALMTGMYPIHTGMQHFLIKVTQPYGLPPNLKTLPQSLKTAGYQTHMVGKWHLGYFEESYVPPRRGFDSFFGYYNGEEDHYTHKTSQVPGVDEFLDLRDGDDIAEGYDGTYSTYMYMKRAEEIVSNHDASKPLFLYMAFQNPHSPAEAPEPYVEKYDTISDMTRRQYCGMVDIMDEAIGNLTRAFKTAGLWDNTLTVFTSDNGGAPTGGGYNWPLRGLKTYLWEGGVHAIGFVHGEMLQTKGLTSKGLMHATDWYPTLLHAAGLTPQEGLDGVNMWNTIVNGEPSPRKEILLNIDVGQKEDEMYQGKAIRMGDMKLVVNIPNSGWYEPPEWEGEAVKGSVGEEATASDDIIPLALYNITADPTEHTDLSQMYPDVVKKMQQRLEEFEKTMVPPRNKPSDPMAVEVANKTGAWGPWEHRRHRRHRLPATW